MRKFFNMFLSIAGIIASSQADVTNFSQCSCGQIGMENPTNISSSLYSAVSGMNISAPGKWCWQVALQNEAGVPFCSAVLIDSGFAITPARCIFGRQPENTFLRIGAFDLSTAEPNSRIIAVGGLFVHQGYQDPNTRNDFDIGLIKLKTSLDCSGGGVCFACLPASDKISLNATKNCQATTWNVRTTSVNGGNIPARPLRERPASILSQIDCVTTLQADSVIGNTYQLADTKFCLKENQNLTGCQGDIGDPLVCLNDKGYQIVGLNTLGFSCMRSAIPSFYTRVSAFSDWINKLRDQNAVRPAVPVGTLGASTAAPPNIDFAVNSQQPQLQVNAEVTTTSTTTTSSPSNNLVVPVVFSPMNGSPTSGVQVHQSAGNNQQQIAADGSLLQISHDGSVQRLAGLPPQPSLLENIAPGVFRANNGGNVIDNLLMTSSDFKKSSSQKRRKRDIAPNVTSAISAPVINVPESSVNFDSKTGRFVINLPTGGQAVSVNFFSSNPDDIKKQIVDQQQQILAQVENLKSNILVSIGAPAMNAFNIQNQASQAPSSAPNKVAVVPNTVAATHQDEDDEESQPEATTSLIAVNRAVLTKSVLPPAAPAPAAATFVNSPSGPTVLRTRVNSPGSTSGSLSSSLQTNQGSGSAAIGFEGEHVSGETRLSPGSASSSVSVSSG